MKILFTTLFLALTMMVSAQDSWKVIHNGKVRLQATEESVDNSFFIKPAELKAKGNLSVFIKDKAPQSGWVRTIMLVDENENELATSKGDLFKVPNEKLVYLTGKAAPKERVIKIYTMSLPSDPKQAALVRVRRIHLATIVIK